MVLPRSAPGWALTLLSIPVIILQTLSLYDPTPFMQEYNVSSKPAAQLIAFCLIIVNIYDLIGALQDNWSVYYFSAISRVSATFLFYSFGPEWHGLAMIEVATLVTLVGAMVVGRSE